MLLQLIRGSLAFPQANKLIVASTLNQSRNASVKSLLPGAQRRPRQSPYLTFVTQEFKEIRQSMGGPETKATQVMVALAARWKTLDEETKEKYKRLSKEIYEQRSRDYQDSTNLSPEQEMAHKLAQRKIAEIKKEVSSIESSLGKPRRPPNPLGLYIQDINSSSSEKGTSITEAVQMWKSLPEEEKQKYREQFQLKVEGYKISRANFEQRLLEDGEVSKHLRRLRVKSNILKRGGNA